MEILVTALYLNIMTLPVILICIRNEKILWKKTGIQRKKIMCIFVGSLFVNIIALGSSIVSIYLRL